MVASAALARRGPDSARTVSPDPTVVLGNTRLRVTDAANRAADMPLESVDGNLTLTFNGEIYNHRALRRMCPDHRFRTDSDAEILLAMYDRFGMDMLRHLEGMFAFCLYDRRQRRSLLAADPTGQKPLYYVEAGDEGLYFASDIDALLAIPHLDFHWDPEGVAQAAGIMFVFGARTHVREIRKLEAGCCLLVEGSRRSAHHRYHKLAVRDEQRDDVSTITREIRDAVADGCARTFDLEVPYAHLLSGGIDSSTVVARAKHHGLTLHTYAIGFDGPAGAATDAVHNEFGYARLVAEAFGTRHRELRMTAARYCQLMDHWWSVCCEPNGAPEAVCLYALFEHIAGDGHRVAFCGSAPDEVFDGYRHGFLLRDVAPDALAGRYFDRFNAVGDLDLRRLLPGVDARAAFTEAVQPYLDLYAHDTRNSQQLACLLNYHGECVVSEYRQMDMASMAHSVEVRTPLADQRVISAAFSFDPALKHRDGSEKWIFKQAMAPWLPATTAQRKKVGFPIPDAVWASPEFEARMRSALEPGSGLDALGVFDMDHLRRVWQQRPAHDRAVFYRLYGLDAIARRQRGSLNARSKRAQH